MARIHRMTKKRLGELLVDEGLITEQQVQEVLAEQKKKGELFGEILVNKSYVTESDIARTITRQFSIPFISARGYDIPQEVVELFSFDMLEKYQFVPIDRFGSVLTVVIAGVMDGRVLEEIEKVSGCTVQVYAGTASDVKETLKKLAVGISGVASKKEPGEKAPKQKPENPAEKEPEKKPSKKKPKEKGEEPDEKVEPEKEEKEEIKPAKKKLSINEILKQALRKQAKQEEEPESSEEESDESDEANSE